MRNVRPGIRSALAATAIAVAGFSGIALAAPAAAQGVDGAGTAPTATSRQSDTMTPLIAGMVLLQGGLVFIGLNMLRPRPKGAHKA